MEESKAKEYIETGMTKSIEFGERIHAIGNRLCDNGEITSVELIEIGMALTSFNVLKLDSLVSSFFGRGSEIRDEIERIDNYLVADPNLAIESLLECTLPEAVQSICHRIIPPEVSHILRVLGWNRRSWALEKTEAGMVFQARRKVRRERRRK
jgi:hypothetical protein